MKIEEFYWFCVVENWKNYNMWLKLCISKFEGYNK